MAEVAIGIYSLLSAAGSAAAGAVGSIGAASGISGVGAAASGISGAAAAGGSSGILSVLQGVATAGSVLTSLAGGIMGYNEAQVQASASELQTREKALRIKEEELLKIGAARVAFAGSGVSLSSGAAVEDSLAADADFERQLAISSGRVEARQIRMRGRGALVGAAGDALGTVANYGIDLRRRG